MALRYLVNLRKGWWDCSRDGVSGPITLSLGAWRERCRDDRDIPPDVTWHVPGRNPISGDYTNRDDTFAVFNRLFEMSNGSFSTEVHDILANDDHTVALLHATARRGEKSLDQDYALVFHIRDGRITEVWEAWTEGTAWDDFWS